VFVAGPPTLDPLVLNALKDIFPTATEQLDISAELLSDRDPSKCGRPFRHPAQVQLVDDERVQ
jgi:hypothetical protein